MPEDVSLLSPSLSVNYSTPIIQRSARESLREYLPSTILIYTFGWPHAIAANRGYLRGDDNYRHGGKARASVFDRRRKSNHQVLHVETFYYVPFDVLISVKRSHCETGRR